MNDALEAVIHQAGVTRSVARLLSDVATRHQLTVSVVGDGIELALPGQRSTLRATRDRVIVRAPVAFVPDALRRMPQVGIRPTGMLRTELVIDQESLVMAFPAVCDLIDRSILALAA